LDFGLAKLTDESAPAAGTQLGTVTAATTHGAILGTVCYMSPEQAEGLAVDARSDVFSLGTMLYEMATGRLPFAGQTPISTITAILRDAPPPVSELRDAIPAALDAVITRCLEKDPDRRFQDAGALRDALRSVGAGEAARPRRNGTRLALGAIAAAVVVALAVSGWTWLRRGESGGAWPGAPDQLTAGRTVAVMGFENVTDPDDAEKLGRVLMGLVTTDLVESRGLDVLSTARVLAAIREVGGAVDRGFDLSVANRAAIEAGAELMLVGQVNRDGERILLAAELVDVRTGKTTGSIRREAGSASELFELAGSIAAEIRRQLGVSTSGDGAAPFDLAESLTSSAEAYRRYAAGELELHLGRFDAAGRHFEAAIGHDPAFALAYFRLGMTRSWAGHREASREALEQGLPHVERLPDDWQRVYRAYVDYGRGRWAEAHDALDALADEQVPIADLYYVLSEIVTHASRYWDPRRVRFLSERALELDPTFATAWFHLLQVYALADDRGALRDAVERLRAQKVDHVEILRTELNRLAAERRFDEMEPVFREMGPGSVTMTHVMVQGWLRLGQDQRAVDACRAAAGDPDVDEATLSHTLAVTQAWRGRFDEADASLAAARSSGAAHAISTYTLASVRIARLTGDPTRAMREAEEAVEIDRENGAAWYWLGRVQIERGDRASAERSLDGLRAIAASVPSPLGAFWVGLLAAELELARGATGQALATLDRIASLPAEHRDRPLEMLVRARALAAAGDTAGAIAAYRVLLDPPYLLAGEHGTPWLDWPLYEAELLYPLALLESADGQTEPAREHLRAYVEHWAGADRPVVGIDDARARLGG
ncbi:MAG TPA: tetratricopeptide repeat protein, partial [Candidatus Polarisedimenticolaceae bacterium]|nr:tetratricopeptide repeat protein [Candidatus Polarisedimenticolaceae bacterium]